MSNGLFFDFHIPLDLVGFIKGILGMRKKDPNTPQVEVPSPNREWFSQARPSTDETVEVLSVNFRLPLSISEIGFEALRVPCHIEVWYQDRSNNWIQMVDRARIPVSVDLNGSQTVGWYKYHTRVYPVVAKAFRFHMKRTTDATLGNQPYVMGLKNVLARRNVYDRADGLRLMEDELDVLGNVIEKTIKDWDAPKAMDSDPITFWRSAPMPDPNAVVSLYLDVRDEKGVAQLIDRCYIDPVYTDQHLNIYYSSDDTVGTLKMSPVTMPALTDTNTLWQPNTGRWDTSTDPAGSEYSILGQWGPKIDRDMWVGIEWTPDFEPTAPPALNPILFQVIPEEDVVGVFYPIVYYDAGGEAVTLILTDGTTTQSYTAPFTDSFRSGDTLRITVGWAYDPDNVRILVQTKLGGQLAFFSAGSTDVLDGGTPLSTFIIDSVDGGLPSDTPDTEFEGGTPTVAGGSTPINLPSVLTMDGAVGLQDFRGRVTAYVLKQESWIGNTEIFLSNPLMYVSPDPVIPDDEGRIPSTTLDNALFAVDWTQQENIAGGSHESNYSDKEWTPIWKDYMCQKGMLFFPQALSMKYLKLEFTNLTEEPYPIYDVGIKTSYKVFPVSVQQQASRGPQYFMEPGGFLGLGNIVSVNGVRSVNWLNPNSVRDAYNAVFGRTVSPINVTTGTGFITETVPNMDAALIDEQTRREFGNRYVYRRDALDPYVLAQDEYNTIIKAEGLQVIAPYTDIPVEEIERANQGAIQKSPTPGSLPVRGTDWWIVPGQTLQIPAATMNMMTSGSVIRNFKMTREHRVRFQTTSVHRYDIKTVTRDAAMAYFAGLREVTPYTTTYIIDEDKDVYDFAQYDRSHWTFSSNVAQLTSGPVSTLDASAATLYKDFQTTSTFAKVEGVFRDSGTKRSDPMWQDIDPVDGLSTQLAYYVETIPSTIPSGFWGDHFAEWGDEDTNWGEPHAVVSVNIDGNRQYQDKRVLHFVRDDGAGEAGIKVRQETHFIRNGLFRIGAIFYKPVANDNQITVRLRRVSDGVYIYEETLQKPVVGYWYEFQTKFVEIPDVEDQIYTVELVMSGDDADELYLSDLYCDVAHVRYYMQLGDGGTAPIHDVTDLRYATGSAIVSTTTPVNQMSLTVQILSNEAWCYGVSLRPAYLR